MRRISPLAVSIAALTCGVAGVVLGVLLLVRGGDEGPQAAPATPTPGEQVANGTATPSETPGYPALRVVGDIPFPADLVMLTTTGGYAHGAGTPWRTRLVVGAPGGPSVITLPPPGPVGGALMGVLAEPGGRELFATVCSGEQCLSEGAVNAATSTFLRSTDGGFRWSEVNSRDGRWWPRLGLDGDVVAVNFDGPETAAVYAASNEALRRPEVSAGLVRYRGKPAWISSRYPLLEDAGGSTLLKFDFLPFEARVTGFAQAAGESRYLLTWFLATPNPVSHGFDYRYFVTAVAPAAIQTFESRMTIGTLAGGWADGKWLINAEVALRPNTCTRDYAKDGDHGLSPAVFDPATGDLAFLGAPFFAEGCAGGAETAVETWTGRTARVHTPGDCLNLRVDPGADAQAVDCLPNGAIVLRLGPITESGGIRRVSVATLGAVSGWVAEEFLGPP